MHAGFFEYNFECEDCFVNLFLLDNEMYRSIQKYLGAIEIVDKRSANIRISSGCYCNKFLLFDDLLSFVNLVSVVKSPSSFKIFKFSTSNIFDDLYASFRSRRDGSSFCALRLNNDVQLVVRNLTSFVDCLNFALDFVGRSVTVTDLSGHYCCKDREYMLPCPLLIRR